MTSGPTPDRASYGGLDADPELAYQGPVLGILDLAGALFEEAFGGVSLFDELAASMDGLVDAGGGSFEPAEGFDFDQLDGFAGAPDSKGFVVVRSRTGLIDQTVYSFRRGGWDYAVALTSGRPSAADDASDYDSNEIIVRAPDGTIRRLSGG